MTGTRNAPNHDDVDVDRGRWYQRVLPVTTLVVAALALAALAVPDFREQVALSASHRTEPYVELAFPRPDVGAPVVCSTSTGTPRVEFLVTSHLEDTEELAYRVSVGRAKEKGTVSVEPGETAQVTRFLGRSTRPYVVTVRLLGTDQELRAHCPGAAR